MTSAQNARANAYAPYSGFAVGAALLTGSGKVFSGCNVENVSFGLTTCAEQGAIAAAVAAGEREFVRLVIVTDSKAPVMPCGRCRQLLAEFVPDLEIVVASGSGATETHRLCDLLPHAFVSEDLRHAP